MNSFAHKAFYSLRLKFQQVSNVERLAGCLCVSRHSHRFASPRWAATRLFSTRLSQVFSSPHFHKHAVCSLQFLLTNLSEILQCSARIAIYCNVAVRQLVLFWSGWEEIQDPISVVITARNSQTVQRVTKHVQQLLDFWYSCPTERKSMFTHKGNFLAEVSTYMSKLLGD